jgi:hypothetical protein
MEEDEDEEDGAREQCSDPWTTLVSIVSVCTVSVAYANGRGDPEGTAYLDGRSIMPCMHHQLAAAPRGCFHGKPACRFHLTARRLQPTARLASHHPPVVPPVPLDLALSIQVKPAISLSLSQSASHPLRSFLSPSDERDQIGGWQQSVVLPSVEV